MAGNEEWRKNADTHKMDHPGDQMRAAGVEQSKRPPGHHLQQQRSKLPFRITTIAIYGLLLSAAIGYMVLYTKRKAEATAWILQRIVVDVAKVITGVGDHMDTHTRK